MKNSGSLRFRMFVPLFLTLLSVSALSCAAATAALTWAHARPSATVLAMIATTLICALFAYLGAGTFAQESRDLAWYIRETAGPVLRGQASATRWLFFAEVADAWNVASARQEETLHLERRQVARSQAEMAELIRMVAKAVEERSPYLRGHTDRVTEYAVAIAEELQMSSEDVERVRMAALAHDLGMIGISDPAKKKTGLLAAKEFQILRAHPAKTASLLRPIESLRDIIPAVELHHEALDGSGYPYGLSGREIPLMARILAVADTFDAMTTSDLYQAAIDPDQALDVLVRLSGTRFDPHVVAALARYLEQQPTGAPLRVAETLTLASLLPRVEDHVPSNVN